MSANLASNHRDIAPGTPGRAAYCFVCSPPYLAQVYACIQSLRRVGDKTQIFVDVLGVVRNVGELFTGLMVHVIPHDVVQRGDTAKVRGYMGVEFACAAKSIFLKHVRDTYDYDYLVYLDSDLFFERSLSEYLLVNGYLGEVLLVPHNVSADWGCDLLNSRSGIFNAGIVGVPARHPFLPWWEEKCRECCVLEPEDGIFVDQKWLDQAPALFDSVRICRDPCINIGYWNIEQRLELLRDAVFYHFSGVLLTDPNRLSAYSDLEVPADARTSLVRYRDELLLATSIFEEKCQVLADYSAAASEILAARRTRPAQIGFKNSWTERRKTNWLGIVLFNIHRGLYSIVPDRLVTLVIAFFRRVGRHSTWYAER